MVTNRLPEEKRDSDLIELLAHPAIGIFNPSPAAVARYATAFRHPSYIREQPGGTGEAGGPDDFERLEFLGDRVLNLIVAEFLFNEGRMSEGSMTMRMEVVKNQHLGAIVPSLGIGFSAMILVAKRQPKTARIIASSFEAFIGAVYLDAGLERTRVMIMRLMGDELETFSPDDNFKKMLQEKVQKSMKAVPEYVLKGKSGPDHCPEFTYQVFIGKRAFGEGRGRSKAVATQNAALAALHTLGDSIPVDRG